jgi:hypothetical protein
VTQQFPGPSRPALRGAVVPAVAPVLVAPGRPSRRRSPARPLQRGDVPAGDPGTGQRAPARRPPARHRRRRRRPIGAAPRIGGLALATAGLLWTAPTTASTTSPPCGTSPACPCPSRISRPTAPPTCHPGRGRVAGPARTRGQPADRRHAAADPARAARPGPHRLGHVADRGGAGVPVAGSVGRRPLLSGLRPGLRLEGAGEEERRRHVQRGDPAPNRPEQPAQLRLDQRGVLDHQRHSSGGQRAGQ